MYPLQARHTFGLNSQTSNLITIQDNCFSNIDTQGPIWILGQGSNCVFVDDFEGTVLHINSKGVDIKECATSFEVSVQAGEDWHTLVTLLLNHGIYGAENLALIPGTVGAAPIQNIGAYGVEVEAFIKAVKFIELDNGHNHMLTRAECKFGYRDSIFKQQLANQVVITEVVFSFPKDSQVCAEYGELQGLNKPTAKDIFDKVIEIRTAKLPDPAKIGNAGSFFKNPVITTSLVEQLKQQWHKIPFFKVDDKHVKVPAAWLIDQSGFKGKKVGGIKCHPSQPLVLTNDGSGHASELLALAREIQSTVKNNFSISLENEVRLIGKAGMISL
ncbi:UDP-N-acetylmuramate dehydrogenase [Aliiglaciecola sp.]|nr:UDP-N-acetylmuramate dehydrogenase [Aliiglaciecola sp.]